MTRQVRDSEILGRGPICGDPEEAVASRGPPRLETDCPPPRSEEGRHWRSRIRPGAPRRWEQVPPESMPGKAKTQRIGSLWVDQISEWQIRRSRSWVDFREVQNCPTLRLTRPNIWRKVGPTSTGLARLGPMLARVGRISAQIRPNRGDLSRPRAELCQACLSQAAPGAKPTKVGRISAEFGGPISADSERVRRIQRVSGSGERLWFEPPLASVACSSRGEARAALKRLGGPWVTHTHTNLACSVKSSRSAASAEFVAMWAHLDAACKRRLGATLPGRPGCPGLRSIAPGAQELNRMNPLAMPPRARAHSGNGVAWRWGGGRLPRLLALIAGAVRARTPGAYCLHDVQASDLHGLQLGDVEQALPVAVPRWEAAVPLWRLSAEGLGVSGGWPRRHAHAMGGGLPSGRPQRRPATTPNRPEFGPSSAPLSKP